MNAVTVAGIVSTLMFLGSNLPMVVQAIRSRDVSSYSRGYLVMTNIGNLVYTVYVLSLPAGPIWLLHLVYTAVSAFMLLVHVWWAPAFPVLRWTPTRRRTHPELHVVGCMSPTQDRCRCPTSSPSASRRGRRSRESGSDVVTSHPRTLDLAARRRPA